MLVREKCHANMFFQSYLITACCGWFSTVLHISFSVGFGKKMAADSKSIANQSATQLKMQYFSG